jgi:hypothetical protein
MVVCSDALSYRPDAALENRTKLDFGFMYPINRGL